MRAKPTKAFGVATIFLAAIHTGRAQGTFQNLDFESPVPPLVPGFGSLVPIVNALPGWSGFIGDRQVNSIVYDARALDAASISLHDTQSISVQPLQGNYSVFLQGARAIPPPVPEIVPVALAQIGQIPQSAKSLVFYSNPFPSTSLQVTFAGQTISLVPLGNTPTFQAFGGDISAYAGQSGELRFTAPIGRSGLLDNIQFSSNPVPEPGAWALFGLGTALFCCAARRKRR